MRAPPAAFLSYAHSDDAYDEGQITELFWKKLSGAVSMQTGSEFHIFHDRSSLQWGDNWKERIDSALDSVTFIIPVVTPSFLNSSNCRDEFLKFLKHERSLGRNDLILPIYYVRDPRIEGTTQTKHDQIAQVLAVLADRQFSDWRDLRLEPLNSSAVRKQLIKQAQHIQEALGDDLDVSAIEQGHPAAPQQSENSLPSAPVITVEPPTGGKKELPTRIVGHSGAVDFSTIGAAVDAARPGDRIVVRPGVYEESLVVNKPLEIVGEGSLGEIVVQGRDRSALRFQSNMGYVRNLTFRQLAGAEAYCVEVAQGRLELHGCDITSESLACVAIHSGADPRLLGNDIHDGRRAGIYIYDGGLGTLEKNEIGGHALAGVVIETGANPTLRANRIRQIKGGGVFVENRGRGEFEDNEISDNAFVGVTTRSGGRPTLRRNRINRNGAQGIWVHKGGGGIFEGNDLSANSKGAWKIVGEDRYNFRRTENVE